MQVSYRFRHSNINNVYIRIDDAGQVIPEGNLLVRNALYKTLSVMETGIEPLLRGMTIQEEKLVSGKYVDDLRNFFKFPEPYDLFAIDIQAYTLRSAIIS
jgi:hypothetical protein